MKKTIHKQRKNLLIVALVVMLILSFAILGIIQTDAAAFYGSLFASSADVDQDANSNVPSSLEPGQVWAGKNVTKMPDVLTSGKFEVVLSALGRGFETQPQKSELSENQSSLLTEIYLGDPLITDSNLVITDTIPTQFDVDSASFAFNGGAPVTIPANTDYAAASGEHVLLDTTNHQVIYTIPSDVLSLWLAEGEYSPNSLKFIVTLNNSANSTGIKYYTDSGCSAVFQPSFDNPYYGYVPEHRDTKEGSDSYTNTAGTKAGWGEPETLDTSTDWSCRYSKELGKCPLICSVTVDGVTYTNGADGTVITVEAASGGFYTVTVVRDTEVPESVKTHTVISFDFNPVVGAHTAYSPLTCQYDYDAHAHHPDCLAIDSVTVNNKTYDNCGNFVFVGANGDYIVTVVDCGTEITCFDLEFANCDVCDALFEIDSPAAKSVTTTYWMTASDAVTLFTINTLPTGDDTPAAVTVHKTPADVTYSGTDTDYESETEWSFTQTLTEGSKTTEYTISLDGDTLTVSYVQTTIIPAHWTNAAVNDKNIATLNLTETGWIILAAPYVTDYSSTQPPSTQPPSTQPPSTQPPSTQPPSTQPPVTGSAGVESAVEKLPQTGGISASTVIALFGLLLIASGGTAVTIIKKKNTGKSK